MRGVGAMPEEQLSDVRRVERKRIVLEVENAIKTRVGGKVTRLEHSVLKSAYPRRPYTEGWRVPVVFTDGQIRDVDVLLSAAFPNVPPRAALVDRPAYLTWPHVEHDGILCLLNNLSEVDPDDPVSVAINILGRAVQLVEELIDGAIVDRDFKEEFLTYWFYGASDAAKDVVTLFEPVSPSRGVFQYKHDGITYVGDDVDQLATWIGNRFGQREATRCRHRAARAAFIWLKEPPLPSQYPKTGADVLALISGLGEDVVTVANETALSQDAEVLFLFAAKGRGGPGVVPVHVDRRDSQKGSGGKDEKMLYRGFRAGKSPAPLLLAKTFGRNKVRRTQVDRADAPWIHGRGQDRRSRSLGNKSVTVFGAGSVGSFVTQDLARSGVGHINIVDYDKLAWANVGRHVLGASSLGKNKAIDLSRVLRVEFPHHLFSGWDISALSVLDEEIEELLNVDLIVSAMGNWSAENALNHWHLRHRQSLNLIYGWTEDHALAGSATVISNEGGCLACGIDRIGNLIQPLTTWPSIRELQTEPSCADHYRPYGAIELANITNMISRVVVDELVSPSTEGYRKNWIGSLSEVKELGGLITPWANKIVGPDTSGEVMAMSQWPSGPCHQCGDPTKEGAVSSKELDVILD